MTLREKKMKAAAIAVCCCLQQESEEPEDFKESGWSRMGKNIIMSGHDFTQRKGRDSRIFK